jgi:hypothetical protein
LSSVFNLENKALRPIGDLTINGIHVDTDILDENIISYDQMASVTKQEMVEAFKNDATPGQEQYICSKRYTKENEVTPGIAQSKRAILKRLYPERTSPAQQKTILSKMADRLE